MWPPAAATTASSLCRNDSGSSDPQYEDFFGREPVAGNHKILSEDHVDCVRASFSERNAQIISAAQRPSS